MLCWRYKAALLPDCHLGLPPSPSHSYPKTCTPHSAACAFFPTRSRTYLPSSGASLSPICGREPIPNLRPVLGGPVRRLT